MECLSQIWTNLCVRGHFGMVNELPYIIYDLSPFGYICMMIHAYLPESFLKFVFVFTLALSVNNLFEERRKTDAEFIFLLFPHKIT